jgi:glycosyltransferase involved in cell wall biosynthesis
MKVLFLYTELADYFLRCCEELNKTAEVFIIRWPVNREAPFEFEVPGTIKIYQKKEYSFQGLRDLVNGISPDMIICSGWIDKDYLRLCKPYFGKIPTVLTCDTHWKASPKQYLAIILSRFFLLNTFSHAWVPGEAQKKYVRKLGFSKESIQDKFYCCDLSKFNKVYDTRSVRLKNEVPKRFLFIGRYYDFKGLQELWKAFISLQEEEPNEWELWCLGTGNLEPVSHPKIKHFGFIQPKNLSPILDECGVFVLPSRFEPWAVVVQEMAAAGFPLLLSHAVGAGERFLTEGKNGFSFQSGDVESLKNHLKKIIH